MVKGPKINQRNLSEKVRKQVEKLEGKIDDDIVQRFNSKKADFTVPLNIKDVRDLPDVVIQELSQGYIDAGWVEAELKFSKDGLFYYLRAFNAWYHQD